MHPTVIGMGAKYCPKAIDFYEDGTPYDRRIFETGTAAHAVLQACGEETNRMQAAGLFPGYEAVARKVAEHLVAKGRSFDGVPEPPLNADRVWAGVKVALDYLYGHPLPVGVEYEIGLAVDSDWNACDYKDGWLQHIADYVTLDEQVDEEAATRTIVTRDYKSQWDAGQWMVGDDETAPPLQSKVRALLSLAHHGEESAEVLSLETVNLRTHAIYQHRFWLTADETQKRFATWRREIESTIAAYSKKPRVAAPGFGCFTCPYLPDCEDGTAAIEAGALSDDPVTAAKGFCAAQGMRDTFKGHLEALTGREPIELPDATVGHHYREQRALAAGSVGQIADDWAGAGGDLRGFARACGLGVGNVEKFAKVFMAAEDTKARKAYVENLCEPVRVKRFGITKKGGE